MSAPCFFVSSGRTNFMKPTYATGVPISLADWVRVFVPRLGVWHHGIVRRIYWNGNGFAVEIANNKKGIGVIASDWHEFAEGQIVLLQRQADPAMINAILSRVDRSLGKPYHLFAQNCEHFASFAFSGKSESQTVKVAALVAAVVVIIGLLGS
jgi:hypothetical protein